MLTTSRKTHLLERLARDGHLAVARLAVELEVSEDTLRRDLRDLAAQGKLVRVHGGAVPASATHRPLDERRALRSEEKLRLARAAAGMIEDGMIVIVDGGTTHESLAPALSRERRCTVVTHSPAIAASFEFHEGVDVVVIGGRLFRHSMVAMGPETGHAFGQVRADLCLLGVTGVHALHGLTTGDSGEAQLKRLMLQASAEVAVLATPDKVGHVSPWRIAGLGEISTIVTVEARPDWLFESVQHVQA